jgi:peptide/nickel transport system ATP-binding protein
MDAEMDDRCYFADRCPKAMNECLNKPPEFQVADGHAAKCVLADHGFDEAEALPAGHFDGGEADE